MRVGKMLAGSAVVALALAALMLGGCSSGGSASNSSGGGSSTEVHIGIGAPLTAGSVAQGQGIQRGVELALAQANDSADVKAAGLKFVGIPGDDQGDPKTGVTIANTFASDRQLIGVVGHLNSGVTIPASKVYNEAKIAMISPAATNPALTLQGLNNVFRVCTIDSVQGPTGADAAFNKFGFKKAVVIDDSTPYGAGLAAAFAKQFVADGGQVVLTEKTSDKDSDFNALVSKIKDANPDLVYYGGVYNAGALLSKQLKNGSVKAPMMGGDGLFDPQYIALAGNADGDLCTSVGLPTDKLPKAQEFQAAYTKMFPGKEIGAYDAYSYDAANVLIGAIVKAAKDKGAAAVTGPAAREEIIANVAATSVDGVTGKIAFDKNGDTTNKAITVYKVEAGKWIAALIPGQ
ncbi:MAG: branched-chain amino acid ABC transporter substrate-binding protein [Coriobacteriia bacterium]|nr:branched-chain amino acid ABC transporter substrate-binding protein [Coriobacteriia bacterium]